MIAAKPDGQEGDLMRGPWSIAAVAGVALTATAIADPKPMLDFDFYKVRVEPIFLQKRSGHTRCYVCHAESNNALHLEKLTPGESTWTREQSHRNYETVTKLVNPGDPATSRLLLHPLAPEAGGDTFHSGGRQFATKDDPAWKTIAAWVNGAQLPPGP
jgi:hypothetical protein